MADLERDRGLSEALALQGGAPRCIPTPTSESPPSEAHSSRGGTGAGGSFHMESPSPETRPACPSPSRVRHLAWVGS